MYREGRLGNDAVKKLLPVAIRDERLVEAVKVVEGLRRRLWGRSRSSSPKGMFTSRDEWLPTSLRRPLTWDRGLEMAKHKTFTVATNVKVYFCDPHSPWQRGTNENTNRLLRLYLPKRTDLSGYTQSELDKIALRLNQRPRKTLGFPTPASKLHASVAPTS
jgi:IS30 family transposase